ncbi:MAG: DNA repair protein RecN [Clostridiales bacterium]|nr:DNA repair protein RecN [Clostridiales bacterium]
MLCQLSIRNIAVIERAEITLSEGLNILTGETGAGKSIIIDSVNLMLGERADRTLIRSGAESAYVEALFDVSGCPKTRRTLFEMFEDNDDELVISRELSAHGRNACRVNGHIATLTQLSKITRDLLDIHGQHEHQSLLNTNNHIRVLDAFCGEQLQVAIKQYQAKLKEYSAICNRIEMMKIDDLEKQRRLEMLTFQYNEINKLGLKVGEEDHLREQRDLLVHAGEINDVINESVQVFSGNEDTTGIIGRLQSVQKKFVGISNISPQFSEISKRIDQLSIECDDIYQEIRANSPDKEFSQKDVDFIEGRISDINKLKKKYGPTIEEILEYCDSIKHQIDDLDENEFIIEDLQKKKNIVYLELSALADEISNLRKSKALSLEKNIVDQLMHLGMDKSKFEITMTSKEDDESNTVFFNNGKDIIEFMIATNPGEPLRPLNKVASGGEMSRIMLALKTISTETDEIATLIFDEIDTGISGNMATVVAQKLATISTKHQVICVTHTAQIAAMADAHNYIEKTVGSLKAKTDVKRLDEEERYIEISRLVGGNTISQYSDIHAKEMITWSNNFKRTIHN